MYSKIYVYFKIDLCNMSIQIAAGTHIIGSDMHKIYLLTAVCDCQTVKNYIYGIRSIVLPYADTTIARKKKNVHKYI